MMARQRIHSGNYSTAARMLRRKCLTLITRIGRGRPVDSNNRLPAIQVRLLHLCLRMCQFDTPRAGIPAAGMPQVKKKPIF
jgi:hypothetical protein